MAGIYGAFLKEKDVSGFHNLLTPNVINNSLKTNEFIIGRVTIDKLTEDRFFSTKNGITICFEGVNLSSNLKSFDDFYEAYKTEGIQFIKKINGYFSGFVLDENAMKVFVFNDHLSSKQIFYSYDSNLGFVFSSEMKAITQLFSQLKLPKSINRDAVYMMALYGFLLEDNTYIKEIKKLPYSSIICFDYRNNQFNIEKYFTYTSDKVTVPINEATHHINTLFENSVKLNWNKDLEYSSQHLSFLSGGMDCKTNLLVAKKLGFEDISTITFGQSESTDVNYSRKIAQKENLKHILRYLDYPKYLVENIEENYIKPLDGLMMFHSSAHASSTIRLLNVNHFSTIHTGQLGDSLFGSFTKPGFDFIKNRGKIGYTGNVVDEKLLDKIEMLPEFLRKYQTSNYDIFNIEQRQINATLNGDRAMKSLIDNISPFANLELINYCLSLPDKYKHKQILYFKWLSKYHNNVLQYEWEKIQMKPNHSYKILYGSLFKKYYNGAKKYFHLKYDSMNPYAIWAKKYDFILNTLDNILEEELQSDYIDSELRQDLRQIYNQNIFEYRNKFAVITALLGLKLHLRN